MLYMNFRAYFSQDSKFKLRKSIWFVMGADFSSLFIIWLLIFINGSALGPAPFSDVGDRACKSKLKQTSIPSTALLERGIPYVKLFSLLPNLYITDKVSQLPGYDILASSLMGK